MNSRDGMAARKRARGEALGEVESLGIRNTRLPDCQIIIRNAVLS